MNGYRSIPFAPFALALAVVAVPALVLPQKQATAYVIAILLAYAVLNADAIGTLSAFVSGKVSKVNQ